MQIRVVSPFVSFRARPTSIRRVSSRAEVLDRDQSGHGRAYRTVFRFGSEGIGSLPSF